MKIDAHQHYWNIARTDYRWLTPDKGVLYRNYEPEHLSSELAAHGIERTVVVQAAPSVEETYYMLELSGRNASIAGVVGWLDLEGEDFERQYAELRRQPKFVGIRPMIQDLAPDWLLRDSVVARMRMLADDSFPVDLQLRPFLMDSALEMLVRVPHLRAVIDHIAKPVRGAPSALWEKQMARLAEYPNVMCKLSGIVPEEEAAWTLEELRGNAAYAATLFGPGRVMFGSDWPVCLLSATYGQVCELLEAAMPPEWTEREKADVWGGNAAAFYRLNETGDFKTLYINAVN